MKIEVLWAQNCVRRTSKGKSGRQISMRAILHLSKAKETLFFINKSNFCHQQSLAIKYSITYNFQYFYQKYYFMSNVGNTLKSSVHRILRVLLLLLLLLLLRHVLSPPLTAAQLCEIWICSLFYLFKLTAMLGKNLKPKYLSNYKSFSCRISSENSDNFWTSEEHCVNYWNLSYYYGAAF